MEFITQQEKSRPQGRGLLPQPLVPVAASVIGGILIARLEWLPLPFQLTGVIACLVLATLVLFTPLLNTGSKKVIAAALLFGGFFFLAQLRYTQVWSCYPEQHIARFSQSEPQLVTVRGRIIREPYISKSRGTFSEFDFRHDPRTIFTLACSEIKTPEGWQHVQGKALAIIKQPTLNLEMGYEVEIDAWLSQRVGPRNPGQWDRTDSYRASRTLVTLRTGYAEAVRVRKTEGRHGNEWGQWRQRLQHLAYTSLMRDGETEEENEYFLAALLLGDREGLHGHLNDIFVRSGSLHFLSVSGLHLGILAGFVWWIGWVLQLPRWLQGFLPLMCVVLFMLIVPERAPILRAGIMSCVFCIAYMSRRKSSALNLLGFAAIIILLVQPLDLFNAGFQLSFAVVWGLVVFVPMVYRLEFFSVSESALDRVRKQYRRGNSWWVKSGRWFLDRLWQLAAVALVAWLVGMPMAAFHFHRIALWGALASLLLFIPIAAMLLLGFCKILLALLLPVWSMQLANWLNGLSNLTIGLTQWLSELPGNPVITAPPPLWFISIFYILLIGGGYRILRGKAIGRMVVGGILIWLIVFGGMVPFRAQETGKSTFHVLDVGHGCAVIGELSDGSVICYDAGSMSRTDIGTSVILPFLRSRGIGQIDEMFVSHANLDHFSAVPDLCQNMDVPSIYASQYFQSQVKRKNEKSATALLLREIKASGLTIQTLKKDDWLGGEDNRLVQIEVLWPPENDRAMPLSANDSSLVLRVEQPGGTILLAGDIGDTPQEWLLTHCRASLKADVLLLPHHGSITKHLAEFVAAVDPKWIVNSSGFLNERKVRNLQKILKDRPVLHTFIHGAIRIDFSKEGLLLGPIGEFDLGG